MQAISLKSMLGYDFEKQLCRIAPHVSQLSNTQIQKQNIIDKSIIQSLVKYQQYKERINQTTNSNNTQHKQTDNNNVTDLTQQQTVQLEKTETKTQTQNEPENEYKTQQQQNIEKIQSLFEKNTENILFNQPGNLVNIIENASGKTVMHMYNALYTSLQGYCINSEIIGLFTQLLGIKNTVTNNTFTLIKTIYPINMLYLSDTDTETMHFKIAKKIMQNFMQYIEPFICDLNNNIKLQIYSFINNTVNTKNLEQLEKQYLKICVYLDILLAVKKNRFINNKDFKKAAYSLQKAQQVSETLGIIRNCFSNNSEKQINANNLYCLPNVFINKENVNAQNFSVVTDENKAPEKSDLQLMAENEAKNYAKIINNAYGLQANNIKKNFKIPDFTDKKHASNIVTIRQTEYGAILRMLIRELCNNGIYTDKTKTIYNSQMFRVLELLTPFIELEKGLVNLCNKTLKNLHITDIIKYRAILQRRIYSLNFLEKTLNNNATRFINEKIQYKALQNQVVNNNIQNIRQIKNGNNNLYGYQEMRNAAIQFNTVLNHIINNYPNANVANINGYINLQGIDTIINDNNVGYFIENICNNTQKLYNLLTTLQPNANIVAALFENLHKSIDILIETENKAQSLHNKFIMLDNFEQMKTDIINYQNIINNNKIKKIQNFYKQQLYIINNFINKPENNCIKQTIAALEKKLAFSLDKTCEPLNFMVKTNKRKKYNLIERENTHIILNTVQPDKYWDYYRELSNNIQNNYSYILEPEINNNGANIGKAKLYEIFYGNNE